MVVEIKKVNPSNKRHVNIYEKNLIIKRNEKIKRKLETKRRQKGLNLKTRDLLLVLTLAKSPTIE